MSNNDNQMTRFLFAILRQKCLKDIDWNEVAKDPILSQPISNGHAARMRYSRFKSSMLGLEPQKRARNGVTKTKATRTKKELKPKVEDAVKSEHQDRIPSVKREGSPHKRVKQEHKQQASVVFHSQFTPASMTDSPTDLRTRLLTPCSDETLGGSPGLLMTPAPELMGVNAAFDLGHCTHDHGGAQDIVWADTPLFSAFDAAYSIEGYGAGICEHQQIHEHEHAHVEVQAHEALGHAHTHAHDHSHEHSHEFSPDGLLDAGTSSIPVKSEPWDPQYI